MKKVYTLRVVAIALSCFFLSSFEDGPANNNKDASGSPFNNASCSSTTCHGGSLSPGTLSVSVVDVANNIVTSYLPGQEYTIKLSVVGGALSHYGFQLLVLNNLNNTSAVSIGTLSTNTPNTQITDFSGKKYAEHSSQLPSGLIEVDWVAPAAGTGTAKIYAVAINANNNGAKTGDQPLAPISALLTEGSSIGLNSITKLDASIQLFINTNADLEILMNSKVEGDFDFVLFDVAGKVIETKSQQIQKGENKFILPIEKLAKGIYTIRISNGTSFLASKFTK